MTERREPLGPGQEISGQLDEIRQLLAQLVRRVSGGVRIGRVVISVQGNARVSTSACRTDVISVLRKATHRMTASEILTALAREGKSYSDRSVKGVLSRLIAEGIADNDPTATPRGYKLVK